MSLPSRRHLVVVGRHSRLDFVLAVGGEGVQLVCWYRHLPTERGDAHESSSPTAAQYAVDLPKEEDFLTFRLRQEVLVGEHPDDPDVVGQRRCHHTAGAGVYVALPAPTAGVPLIEEAAAWDRGHPGWRRRKPNLYGITLKTLEESLNSEELIKETLKIDKIVESK